MIELGKPGEMPFGCIVIAKVPGDSAFEGIATAITDAIDYPSLARTDTSAAWIFETKILQAKLVGERGRRVIQITAMLKS